MRRTAWTATAALITLGPASLLQAQQERPAPRRDTTAPATATANPTADRSTDREAAGADRAAAVGHALCMAIEGSELWCAADHLGGSSTTPATTRDQAQNPNTNRNPNQNNEPANTSRATGSSNVNEALRQHARSAFQGADRLFATIEQQEDQDRAGDQATSQACEQFYQAARRYSMALQECCRISAEGAGAPRQDATAMKSVDAAQMVLLNHAVKEAVSAVAIRKMVQHHGDTSTTAKALNSHASEMLRSAQSALQAAGGTTRRTAAHPVAGEVNATIPEANNNQQPRDNQPARAGQANPNQDLESLAQQVIDAVQRLDQPQGQGSPSGLTRPQPSDAPPSR